eukprot:2218653-Ditylum_brightwellii.AAC.1
MGDTITMHKSGDPTLCPVLAWAETVKRLLILPSASPTTPVNTVAQAHSTRPITATKILDDIRSTVTRMGKDRLGFTANEVGTHSNRSAAAMAMYLAQVPVYTIMLIGQWSSDAFFIYIRKQ